MSVNNDTIIKLAAYNSSMTEEKDFLTQVKEDAEAGMQPEQIIEKHTSRVNDKEFAEELGEKLQDFIQESIEDSTTIFEMEDLINEITEEVFQHLGFTKEELEEHFQDIETEEVQEMFGITEDGDMTYQFVFEISHLIAQSQSTEEHRKQGQEIFREAVEADEEMVREALNREFEWNKFKKGFQHGFHKVAKQEEDAPREVRISNIMESVKKIVEGIMKPTAVFTGQLITIIEGNSGDVENWGSAKDIIQKSDYDWDEFWSEDARKIRNGESHSSYDVVEDGVEIETDEGETVFYTDEELGEVLQESAEKARNVMLGLATGYKREVLSEEDTELYDTVLEKASEISQHSNFESS